jgi:hypothetical protein
LAGNLGQIFSGIGFTSRIAAIRVSGASGGARVPMKAVGHGPTTTMVAAALIQVRFTLALRAKLDATSP